MKLAGASLTSMDLARVLPAGFASLASRGRWVSAPHLTYLSLRLADAMAGGLPRVIVQMPPRHGKSSLVSQYFPVWWLGNRPDDWVLLTSYSDRFAANWGRKTRDLMLSMGSRVFGVSVRGDQKATDDWGLAGRLGGMSTAGVGGTLTGRGANLLIIDDPIKDAQAANSQLIRDNLWEWWQSTASTRLEPGGVAILVMTRWHEDDLAGRLIREMNDGGERWEVISLPAIATCDEALASGTWSWARGSGEALWPQRYPLDRLLEIKRRAGSYWWSALYQQSPQAEGGSVFQIHWFHVVEVAGPIRRSVRFWDCASSAATSTSRDPDYTVGTRIDELATGRFLVSDVVRGQWSPADVDRAIHATAARDGKGVAIREEQEGGSSGLAVVRARARTLAGYDYAGVPASGEKVTAWRPFAAQAEAENVDVLRAGWNTAWFDELRGVPRGSAHDDQADSAAGAFNALTGTPRSAGMVTIRGL